MRKREQWWGTGGGCLTRFLELSREQHMNTDATAHKLGGSRMKQYDEGKDGVRADAKETSRYIVLNVD